MSDTPKTGGLTAGITKCVILRPSFPEYHAIEPIFDAELAALELTAARLTGDASHSSVAEYYDRLEQQLRHNGAYIWAMKWAAPIVDKAPHPFDPVAEHLGLR